MYKENKIKIKECLGLSSDRVKLRDARGNECCGEDLHDVLRPHFGHLMFRSRSHCRLLLQRAQPIPIQ